MSVSTERDEAQERTHLGGVLRVLDQARERLAASIDRSSDTIQESKQLIWEGQRDMDHAEKANIRIEVDVSVGVAQRAKETHRQVQRLLRSPYFGRVDFRGRSEQEPQLYYIGLHSFRDPDSSELLIHDWRAPVSALFYDFESGEASFEAPSGTIEGEITGKRQYKIEEGQLQYMLESSLNIGDDVLQQELSRSADDKMKNIVATIQREQNAIIRNEESTVLILQGVAGSGKTSIALHRIAFLLYRFKETLSYENVMILSPNKVFGDYISDVLPELGENQVAETDFDAVAHQFLTGVVGYESFSEQVMKLLDAVDDRAVARMHFKSTPEFVTDLEEWITEQTVAGFTPAPIEQRYEELSAEWVADRFATLDHLPVFTRLERVADSAIHSLKHAIPRGTRWTAADTTGVRKQVRGMFAVKTPFEMYKAFYNEPARQGYFVPLTRKKIEYADVFPLIYTMLRTSRHETPYGRIQHLLIDEMQDYTPIQYAVLRHLFSCRMTILGDANQSVNPFSSSSLDTIRRIFPEADCLELNKSYRSTAEITAFAQNISYNSKIIPIDRHGAEPEVIACVDQDEETSRIAAHIERFRRSEHRSMGIICKTVAQARSLATALEAADLPVTFLDYDSTTFADGVIVTSAHISKGLEFDTVIAPHVDADNYSSGMDRSMLYIVCTRAMHELTLTHSGAPSPLLAPQSAESSTRVLVS